MATCIECSADKPGEDFYAHSGMASGHVNVCKECHKTRMKIRRQQNSYVQEYDRNRAKSPSRREHSRAVTTKWRKRNPLAAKAHSALGNAVRNGKIKKLPCEICGRPDVHAHHKDYSKPLDVVWLCPKCHHRIHALFPELEGKRKA